MLSFESDYTTGAHPQILGRLLETNLEPLSGYGMDPYCASAREKILRACGLEPGSEDYDAAAVELLVGGTQTNQIVISTMLRDHEGVVAADTGHVNVHEAGAIEYAGHKVLVVPRRGTYAEKDAETYEETDVSMTGKIAPADLRRYVASFYADANHDHMVFPGMVYLSHPTEYGTLYSKAELTEIAQVCRQYDMRLYVDGARLGYALASPESDVTLPDLARLTDAFYIGGTKVGALCGEAIVFMRGSRPAHFVTSVKKRGGLLAKGRLLGIQFDTLFSPASEKDGELLYMSISRHVMRMTRELCAVLHRYGISFYLQSPTNQQFVILEDAALDRLRDRVAVSFWEKYDESHTVVRFAAGWSTTEEDLEELEKVLGDL